MEAARFVRRWIGSSGADAVSVVDAEVAVGIGVEVNFSVCCFVEHDAHPDRAGTAVPDAGVAAAGFLASIGCSLYQFLGLVSGQYKGAERGVVEWVAGGGQDIAPAWLGSGDGLGLRINSRKNRCQGQRECGCIPFHQ